MLQKSNIKKKKLEGLIEIFPDIYKDDRGFVTRFYEKRVFQELGLNTEWTEDLHHHTNKKYTLRGLYIQAPPFTEGKIMRAIKGKMLWIVVDVRKDSPTFGQWDSAVLDEEKMNLLYTPRGLAHGALSLTDDVDLVIKGDTYFSAEEHGIGIRWNDPELNIDWGLEGKEPIISEEHKNYPSFKEFKEKYGHLF